MLSGCPMRPKTGPFPGKRRWRGLSSKRAFTRPSSTAHLFDEAQRIIAGFESHGWGRRRFEKVSHCPAYWFAATVGRRCMLATPPGRPRCYRCSSNAQFGKGSCGTYEITADLIEPFIFKEVGLGIRGIDGLLDRSARRIGQAPRGPARNAPCIAGEACERRLPRSTRPRRMLCWPMTPNSSRASKTGS